MVEEVYNGLEHLSYVDLIDYAHQKLGQTRDELKRRNTESSDFLYKLNSFGWTNLIWRLLWMSGGAVRFTDLLSGLGCSRQTLKDHLDSLINNNLVRQLPNLKYQVICPPELCYSSTTLE